MGKELVLSRGPTIWAFSGHQMASFGVQGLTAVHHPKKMFYLECPKKLLLFLVYIEDMPVNIKSRDSLLMMHTCTKSFTQLLTLN